MDATAISLCMDNKLPIIVFDLTRAGQHQADRARRAGGLDRVVVSRPSEGMA